MFLYNKQTGMIIFLPDVGGGFMELFVRPLAEGDYPTLVKLFEELGYPASLEEMHIRFKQLSNHTDYHSLVAVMDNQVVGFSGLCKMHFFEKNGTYTRILAFVVSEKVRKLGVGTKLLESSEEWARKMECSTIVLNSGNRKERQLAHAFYTSKGYLARSTGFSKEL